MAQHRASVTAAIVQHESAVLAEFNIGREQIMAPYWNLARLAPADTNGNITGQVRVLDSLREMLGLVGPQPGSLNTSQKQMVLERRRNCLQVLTGEQCPCRNVL